MPRASISTPSMVCTMLPKVSTDIMCSTVAADNAPRSDTGAP
ncbi:hypothetical protein [Nocardia cyriacigeorgica]